MDVGLLKLEERQSVRMLGYSCWRSAGYSWNLFLEFKWVEPAALRGVSGSRSSKNKKSEWKLNHSCGGWVFLEFIPRI